VTARRKLPDGHMRVTMQITVEGPVAKATKSLVRLLKTLPREQRIQAAWQIGKRLRELQRKAQS
jgi:hypothetical protein